MPVFTINLGLNQSKLIIKLTHNPVVNLPFINAL